MSSFDCFGMVRKRECHRLLLTFVMFYRNDLIHDKRAVIVFPPGFPLPALGLWIHLQWRPLYQNCVCCHSEIRVYSTREEFVSKVANYFQMQVFLAFLGLKMIGY